MTRNTIQDYLKTIYSIAESGRPATTSAIAERLGVSPATVTAMVKRLSASGELLYRRYRGVELTDKGLALALEVIRHHRLLEEYLHRQLGIPWDRVHEEAEVLEHAISEEVEDRMAAVLGHPTHDPHGDPIPPKSGPHRAVRHAALSELEGPATVRRVSDRDPEALRYLEKLGLRPGTSITIGEKGPFGGPVWVTVGKRKHAIGRELADCIYVSPA
ncbi:MAG: metal-dependent transcriptional regulator [Actinomycetota bacterium]